MNKWEIVTMEATETKRIGEKIGQLAQPGDVIALEGDLGAGKTTLTQGIAVGLQIKGNVNSPTFTIVKEYEGRLPLYHMDVYRVEDEWEELGLEEYFYGDGVTVIEWASLISAQLPDDYLSIHLYHVDERRKMIIKAYGARADALGKELQQWV